MNANYTMVDVAANTANMLGRTGSMKYGQHFIFKTVSVDEILFNFCDESD